MWVGRMVALSSALAVSGALLVGAGPASAASLQTSSAMGPGAKRTVYLLDCRGDRPKIKPKSVILACGDAGAVVERASWTHWGTAPATASAVLVENDCTPTCVGGTFRSEPARVTVTKIHTRQGIYVYGFITVVPKGPNRYGFKTVRETIPG